MYYGTKKVYSFLENGNSGDCNCEQEYQNGYDAGYAEGSMNAGGNVFASIGWDSSDTAALFPPVLNESIKALDKFNNREDRMSCANMFRGEKSLTFAPKFDMSEIVYADLMFYQCWSIVALPDMYAPNLELTAQMFEGCKSLSRAPFITTENVVNFYRMFWECDNLKYVPDYNTSNATACEEMFYDCVNLERLPQFDFSKVEEDLGSFFGYGELHNLTEVGGFVGLKIDWNNDSGLFRCPNLTYESVMNVINGLYDFRANDDWDTYRTLKIHPNSMALLSDDDKFVAINKGWILTY